MFALGKTNTISSNSVTETSDLPFQLLSAVVKPGGLLGLDLVDDSFNGPTILLRF